jgi:sulfotransferase
MKDLFLLKQTDVFLNYQDHDSLDNVLDSVFDNYYKDWPQQYIIDRGPVMTPGNLMLMQKHYKRPFKCIVILRDLMDVLASYMKWYKNNPDAFPNRYNLNTDDEKLGMIMNKDGAVAKDLEAIKNAFNYPDICHFVKYDDLISRPEQEMRKIYQFIGLPYYNHQFQNLKQINVNGIGYDDKVVGKNMHTIRNVVRKEINPYLDQIPERIRQKYGHIRF